MRSGMGKECGVKGHLVVVERREGKKRSLVARVSHVIGQRTDLDPSL